MYCVEWKTRKASPARKSRDERRPATGRRRKPVHAVGTGGLQRVEVGKHTSSGPVVVLWFASFTSALVGGELTL